MTPPADSRRLALRALAFSLLGMVVIVLTGLAAARALGEQDPLGLLAQVQPAWMLLAVCLACVGQSLHGARVVALLPAEAGPRPGALRLGLLYLASIVLNLSFPGPAGELAAAWVVQRRSGTRAAAVLAASLHGRFAGLLTGALALALSLPWLPVDPRLGPALWGGGLVVAAGGAGLALLSLRPRLLVLVSQRTWGVAARLPGLPGRICSRIDGAVVELAHQLRAVVARPAAYLQGMGWSVVMLGIFVATALAAARSLGIAPALPGAWLAVTSSQVTSLAAVAVPGGLGVFDLAFAGSLVAAGGLDPSQAAGATVAIRIVQVLVLVPGVLVFLRMASELLAARPAPSAD